MLVISASFAIMKSDKCSTMRKEEIYYGRQFEYHKFERCTEDEDTTCGINDMNCLSEDEDTTCGINDMNCVAEDEDTTCGINDMNCLGE